MNAGRIAVAILLLGSAAVIGGLLLHNAGRVPALSVTTLTGQSIALADRQGRPLVIHFWSTTCIPCIAKIPALIEFYQRIPPHTVDFVAVAMPYDTPERVVAMQQQRKLPYPIALDRDGEITAALGDVRFTPTTLLISPDGRIVQTWLGTVNFQALEQDLDNLTATAF